MLSPKIRVLGLTILIITTVILAAVVYFYTTGFLASLTDTQQNIFFSMECDDIDNEAMITYSGGETIPSEIVTVEVNGKISDTQFENSIEPTDRLVISDLEEDDTVSILFDSEEENYSLNSCSL